MLMDMNELQPELIFLYIACSPSLLHFYSVMFNKRHRGCFIQTLQKEQMVPKHLESVFSHISSSLLQF